MLVGRGWAYIFHRFRFIPHQLPWLALDSNVPLGYFTAFPKLCSCGTICITQSCITQLMEDTSRTSPAPAPDAGRWIGRLLIAVILGEGIWGLIVSVTNNLILPYMARTMGTDSRSPLSLGNGQFNVPGLFTSVLEICFAGIVAVILNSWIRRKPKVSRRKPVRVTPIPVQPVAPPPQPLAVVAVQAAESVPPPAAVAVPMTATGPRSLPPSSASQSPGQFWSPPEPTPPKTVAPPPPPKAGKPKPPREIVYNSVGEPLPFDDE